MKTRIWTAIFTAVLFLYSPVGAFCQELPKEIIRLIESECENELADPEEMEAWFREWVAKPMNLNTADRDELSSMPLFTPFMVESLLDYREEYGRISSYAELSLVDGFDEDITELLRPFITLGQAGLTGRKDGTETAVSNTLVLRSRATFQREREETFGSPVYRYARYGIALSDKAQAGFTLESDAGEKGFPDFCSLSLGIKDIPLSGNGLFRIGTIALGDYSLRFGQGLVLWSGFAMSSLSTPASVLRSPSEIRPYTSSGESGFFRGCAVNLELGTAFRLSLFYSNLRTDAMIDGEYFTTKPEDGLHDSERALKSKGGLGERVGGFNLSWRNSFLKVGLTAAAYGYDKKDGRRKSYYNEHLRYDGLWLNVSTDFVLSFKGVRVFGELAADRRFHLAAIVGATYPFSSQLEASLLCRYYDHRYIATYSGAYSNTSCNNECGASAVVRYVPVREIVLTANAAYTHYPYHRYGVRGPSDVLKASVDMDWAAGKGHSLYFKASCSLDTGRDTRYFRLRGEYLYTMVSGFELATRLEGCAGGSSLGGLCFQEMRYTSPSGKFRSSLRATLFSAQEWESRIYCYERDIPGTFSVPAYYGKGAGLYIVTTYKPVKWFSLSFKCSATKYLDASKDNLKLKMQLSWLF